MVVWLGMEVHLLLPRANKLLSVSFGDLMGVLNASPLTYTYQMGLWGSWKGGVLMDAGKGQGRVGRDKKVSRPLGSSWIRSTVCEVSFC